MQWCLYILILLFLGVTFYQDYKYRAVSWFVFPLLFGTCLALNIYKTSWAETLYNSIVNFCFIFMILGTITIYFSIKYRRLVNITSQLIGWGDILFLLCLGVLFSPVNFMLFYTISLFVIALFSVLCKMFSPKSEMLIPLAGLQAALLMAVLYMHLLFPVFSFSNDTWVYYFFYV